MKKLPLALTSVAAAFSIAVPFTNVTQASAAAPVAVQMFMQDPGNIVNINTNWFTKFADKKFNMKLSFIDVSGSDSSTKQSVLLNSGDYPPVFWAGYFSPEDQLQYGTEGVLIPLNNLIKKYAPNVEHYLKTNSTFRDGIVAPNGNIYSLPGFGACIHCDFSAKMWINQRLLQKYHLSMPTTTAQFTHVLEVFKQHGITPLSGANTGDSGGWHSDPTTFLMNSFQYDDENDYFFINKNKKLDFSPIQPGWYQGLKYIHGLYAQGLIAKGSITQNNDVLQRQVNGGKLGAFPWGCKNCIINNYGQKGSHYLDWTTVAPLKGPSGVHYAAFFGGPQGTASGTFAITNKATPAQQEAVMKLVNYVYSPVGSQTASFGPEGKAWTFAKKGQKGILGTQALFNTNNTTFFNGTSMQNLGWDTAGPMLDYLQNRYGQVAFPPNSPNGSESMLQLETEKNYVGDQPTWVYQGFVWLPAAQTQQYSLYQTNINNYVQEWDDQFIVGTKPLTQANWNAFVSGIKNLGLDQYLKLTSEYSKPFNTTYYKKDVHDVKFLESLDK